MDDRPGRCESSRALDQPDQGGRSACGAEGDRRGCPDAWRARCQPGYAAGPRMDTPADVAACRRPRCRASKAGRPRRVEEIHAGASSMKAVVARNFGPLGDLSYDDWPEPEAEGDTVVIQSEAIGVNFPDGLLVQ